MSANLLEKARMDELIEMARTHEAVHPGELLGHIKALEADNAALLDLLKDCMEAIRLVAEDDVTEALVDLRQQLPDVLAQPHPGAALLEEHRKALIARSNLEEANASLHEQLAQMERGHAKALVRARNEGLERAALLAESWDGVVSRWEAGDRIRAQKEPE
jgi:hypothetical protein